jgi:hypothetical protein
LRLGGASTPAGPVDAANLSLWGVFRPHTAREALADAYGRAIAKEFGAILLASADQACLEAKGLDAARLQALGADLLVRYGQKLVDLPSAMVDDQAVGAELAVAAGPKALAELRGLARARSVQTFRDRGRPARLDRTVDLVAEHFDRYLALQRLALARPLSPLGSGSTQLAELNRIEAAEAAAERYVRENKGDRKLQRFVALAEQWDAAFMETLRKNPAARTTPLHAAFKGVEDELAAACVSVKQ